MKVFQTTDSKELKPCDNVWCHYYDESCNGNCWYYGNNDVETLVNMEDFHRCYARVKYQSRPDIIGEIRERIASEHFPGLCGDTQMRLLQFLDQLEQGES